MILPGELQDGCAPGNAPHQAPIPAIYRIAGRVPPAPEPGRPTEGEMTRRAYRYPDRIRREAEAREAADERRA